MSQGPEEVVEKLGVVPVLGKTSGGTEVGLLPDR